MHIKKTMLSCSLLQGKGAWTSNAYGLLGFVHHVSGPVHLLFAALQLLSATSAAFYYRFTGNSWRLRLFRNVAFDDIFMIVTQ